jgi:hypothetical protein
MLLETESPGRLKDIDLLSDGTVNASTRHTSSRGRPTRKRPRRGPESDAPMGKRPRSWITRGAQSVAKAQEVKEAKQAGWPTLLEGSRKSTARDGEDPGSVSTATQPSDAQTSR